ncbi:unnamed protein product, partial [Laminaria digitata]
MRHRARPVRFLDYAMINTGDVDAYEAVTSASGHENDTRIGQACAKQIFGSAEFDAVRDTDAAYRRRRRRGDSAVRVAEADAQRTRREYPAVRDAA